MPHGLACGASAWNLQQPYFGPAGAFGQKPTVSTLEREGVHDDTTMPSLQRAGYGACFGFSCMAIENPCTGVQGFG